MLAAVLAVKAPLVSTALAPLPVRAWLGLGLGLGLGLELGLGLGFVRASRLGEGVAAVHARLVRVGALARALATQHAVGPRT